MRPLSLQVSGLPHKDEEHIGKVAQFSKFVIVEPQLNPDLEPNPLLPDPNPDLKPELNPDLKPNPRIRILT